MTEEVLRKVVDEVSVGRRVALCAIVATRGSTPQPVGAMVCVDRATEVVGTLGGGCVEADVRRQAHECLSQGVGRVTTFTLDHDFGYDDGMLCGGQMDIAMAVYSTTEQTAALVDALEKMEKGAATEIPLCIPCGSQRAEYRVRVAAAPKLLIVGGGHIGRLLAQMMVTMDFRVTVLDDRSAFANPQRFPAPIDTVAGDIAATLREWPIDANTYVVIVTRGHKHDEAALRAVLTSPARYLGMIGSRRKIRVIWNDLGHEGVSDDQLARIHAPIGLDIGAVTAAEIALSIAAQLISVRRAEPSSASDATKIISRAAP